MVNVFMAFKLRRFLIVPYQLCHVIFTYSSEVPPRLVAFYDMPRANDDLF